MNLYKTIFLLSAILLGLITYSQQNPIVIKGKVVAEETKQPVQGANITLKGSTDFSLTNGKGEFAISVKSLPDTLIVTHVSFQEVRLKISGSENSDFIIPFKSKPEELSEVIVNTGVQKLPKERATGSFTHISSKLYNEQVGTDVLSRLKYITNGVTTIPQRVGTEASGNLLVRGLSTLSFSIQKPLIILDDFEYQGELSNINPNDVENITFLKDAAAGSVWGARAANGVIVITTKKGKFNQPYRLSLTSNFTIIEKPNLNAIKTISTPDFINYEKELFKQGYYDTYLSYPQDYALSPVVNTLQNLRQGLISQQEADNFLSTLNQYDFRRELKKHLFQSGVNQQYSVSASGGSENHSWIVSAGHDRNVNELEANYQRNNIRIDNIYRVTSKLKFSGSIYYTQSRNKAGRPGMNDLTTTMGIPPPYTHFFNSSGNEIPFYNKYNQSYIDTAGNGKLLDWKYYPLSDYNYLSGKSLLQDFNSVVGVNYAISPTLNFDIKYRYKRQTIEDERIYEEESYYTRDLINTYSQINYSTGVVNRAIPRGAVLDIQNSANVAKNLRGQINYNKSWAKHDFSFLSGFEISNTQISSNSFRTYGFNRNVLTFSNVDYSNTVPTIFGYSNFIPNNYFLGKRTSQFMSVYNNTSYTFEKRYILSLSFRSDASNLFGVDINDKWKPLWSAGSSWNISKEKFYSFNFIPSLTLRATYGHQGNVDPSKVAVTTFRYLGQNPFTNSPFGQIRNFYNPDLTWEQVAMWNIGLDFAVRNNRIRGSIEYYAKNITNLYGPYTIDPTTGLGTRVITKNVGEMKGRGWDIELNSINVDKKIKWTSTFILNLYKDKITKYYDPSTFFPSDLVGEGGGIEGKPTFALSVYKWAGLDKNNGDPLGYIDGIISNDWSAITSTGATINDIKYIGSRVPTMYGSVGNTLEWNNVILTARITYNFGHYFLRESINYSALAGSRIGHSDFGLRWVKPGDEKYTSVPSLPVQQNASRDLFYQNSEALVTKGDHIRFQYLRIGYVINRVKRQRLPFSSMQIYAVASDLGLIWKANKHDIDPDFSNRSLPTPLSISAGIKIDF